MPRTVTVIGPTGRSIYRSTLWVSSIHLRHHQTIVLPQTHMHARLHVRSQSYNVPSDPSAATDQTYSSARPNCVWGATA